MKAKHFLLLFLLALCWGPSFLFIKIGIGEMSPLMLVTLRIGIAALLLYIFIRCKGLKLWPHRKHYKHFVFMGFFAAAFPFLLISYGEETISSSLAGIVNGSVPIYTALFAHYFIPSERLTVRKIVGIGLGFAGIIVIFFPTLFDGVPGDFRGVLLVFIACLSYTAGMIYSKKYMKGIPGLVKPTAQLIVSTCLILPFALIFEYPYTMPSWSGIGSVMGLAILGTGTAFVLYYKIIEVAGAVFLSTSSLLFPVIAIALGMIFLGERPEWYAYVGAACILSGLVVTNSMDKTLFS